MCLGGICKSSRKLHPQQHSPRAGWCRQLCKHQPCKTIHRRWKTPRYTEEGNTVTSGALFISFLALCSTSRTCFSCALQNQAEPAQPKAGAGSPRMGWFCLVFFKAQENNLKDTHLHRAFRPQLVTVSSRQGAPQVEKDPVPTKITVAEERANINQAAQPPCRVITGYFSIGKQNISQTWQTQCPFNSLTLPL